MNCTADVAVQIQGTSMFRGGGKRSKISDLQANCEGAEPRHKSGVVSILMLELGKGHT